MGKKPTDDLSQKPWFKAVMTVQDAFHQGAVACATHSEHAIGLSAATLTKTPLCLNPKPLGLEQLGRSLYRLL